MCGIAAADITAILKPPEDGPIPAAPTKPSHFRFILDIPLQKLSTIVNRYAFTVTSKSNPGEPDPYDAVLTIEKISFAQSGQPHFPIEVTAPFRFRGKVKGSDRDDSGTVKLNFGFRVSETWCPPLIEFEIASVDLDGSFAFLRNLIAQPIIKSQLDQLFECNSVKKFIAQFWQTVDLPVQLGDTTLFLNVEPQSITIANLVVEGSNIKLMLDVGTTANLKTKATKSGQRPLPENKKGQPQRLFVTGKPAKPTRDSEMEGTLSVNIGVDFR
jgi:hypothetical protein